MNPFIYFLSLDFSTRVLIGGGIVLYFFIGRWIALTGWNLWTTSGHHWIKACLLFPYIYLSRRERTDPPCWDGEEKRFFGDDSDDYRPFCAQFVHRAESKTEKIEYFLWVLMLFPIKITLNLGYLVGYFIAWVVVNLTRWAIRCIKSGFYRFVEWMFDMHFS